MLRVLEPPPSDTWAGILLDGLAGGLIGALATILVIYATIRHERKMRDADRLDDAVAAAASAASDIRAFLTRGIEDDAQKWHLFARLVQTTSFAMARAQRNEHELAVLLNDAARDLHAAVSIDKTDPRRASALNQANLRLSVALGYWVTHPEHVRHGTLTYDKVRDLTDRAEPGTPPTQPKFPAITRRMRLHRWRHERRRRRNRGQN